MAHDCRIAGVLGLMSGVSRRRIKQAFAKFIDTKGLSTFKELVAEGQIQIDGRLLDIAVDFYSNGGYDEAVVELVQALSDLCKPGTVELRDFDCGGDENPTAFFVGKSLQQRQLAQVEYALDQSEPWLAGLLDERDVAALRRKAIAALKRRQAQRRHEPRATAGAQSVSVPGTSEATTGATAVGAAAMGAAAMGAEAA